jgi:hypothetical protein
MLTAFTVNPALPAGLSLNPTSGTISGTPTAITPKANYTVDAAGSGGASATTTVSIAVNDVAPTAVSYGAASFTFSATLTSSTLTPTAGGGKVVSWSINPALPSGLNFSTSDGSISGTPSAAAASANYAVTAQNSGGQSTVTLAIQVDAGPLSTLGHQSGIGLLRATAANVLSVDSGGYWILWNFTTASVVAQGLSACSSNTRCGLTPAGDMVGSTAVIATPTGLEVHAASDGHTLGSIPTSGTWWRLASDGTYIASGSTTGLSAWSPSGQLLFSHAGDYSHAIGFAAPGQVLIGAGPAGANVVETVAVPSGTATTGPQFNGTFGSWFLDGSRFATIAGTTVLVYSNAAAQQGSIAGVPAGATVVGQGNWVWTYPTAGSVLSIYPATGTNAAATATYTFGVQAQPSASGTSVGVLDPASTTVSVIDLSGSTPVKTDYTAPAQVPLGGAGSYAAVSASQWLVGNGRGVLLDGASLGGTLRYFGFGAATSIAGGTGYFAVATASGNIVYFNSTTWAQEGQIAFPASKLALSADGTLLVAQGSCSPSNVCSVQVYSLPAGSLLYTWPYTLSGGTGTSPQDIALSGSGNVLGQILFTEPGGGAAAYYTQQASAPTGGSQVFSNTFNSPTVLASVPPVRISPDGTLIATSQQIPPAVAQVPNVGTNLLLNGTLVTAFSGWPVGWLDNSRLLVNNYALSRNNPPYSGCTIYGANGSATGAPCAIPIEVTQLQPVTTDTIFVPAANQMLSVSTGSVGWMSGDPDIWLHSPVAAVAGSRVIFVSGTSLLAQPY